MRVVMSMFFKIKIIVEYDAAWDVHLFTLTEPKRELLPRVKFVGKADSCPPSLALVTRFDRPGRSFVGTALAPWMFGDFNEARSPLLSGRPFVCDLEYLPTLSHTS